MSNFITEYKKGQAGVNKGLYLGKGLESLYKAINGLQRRMTYVIAASPKVGKSTLVDYGFLINPWLDAVSRNIPVRFIYFSFEMDRVTKEFDFICYFLYADYGIEKMSLPDDIIYKKNNERIYEIDISSDLLRGRITDENGKTITLSTSLEELVFKIHNERIIPLFGNYDEKGNKLQEGVIDFIPTKTNPTGLRNCILDTMKSLGTIEKKLIFNKKGEPILGDDGRQLEKTNGYTPIDPEQYVIVITDTIRKIPTERGFTMKQNIDKFLEYATELRDNLGVSFIHIVHLNRDMADIHRQKAMGEYLHPSPEQIKDSGNASEEANHVITMFNPNDDRYGLKKHFGVQIKDNDNNQFYPELRTLHLVESRHSVYPQHFGVFMQGNIKNFNKFNNE